MSKFTRYLINKVLWFLFAFAVALVFNFLLIRLIPGNLVDMMVQRTMSGGGVTGEALQKMYKVYIQEFGLDKPMWEQFLIYLGNLAKGDLGVSFSQYPIPVAARIFEALPWTIALQLPAILIGWFLRNCLAVFTAYKKATLHNAA